MTGGTAQGVADGVRLEVDLGPLGQIPVGEGRAFAAGGEQVAVFRLSGDRVRALSAVCTHRGGPIADGQIDDSVVVCPLHMHAFSLATGCSSSGADPLRSYPVRVVDGRILLSLP